MQPVNKTDAPTAATKGNHRRDAVHLSQGAIQRDSCNTRLRAWLLDSAAIQGYLRGLPYLRRTTCTLQSLVVSAGHAYLVTQGCQKIFDLGRLQTYNTIPTCQYDLWNQLQRRQQLWSSPLSLVGVGGCGADVSGLGQWSYNFRPFKVSRKASCTLI